MPFSSATYNQPSQHSYTYPRRWNRLVTHGRLFGAMKRKESNRCAVLQNWTAEKDKKRKPTKNSNRKLLKNWHRFWYDRFVQTQALPWFYHSFRIFSVISRCCCNSITDYVLFWIRKYLYKRFVLKQFCHRSPETYIHTLNHPFTHYLVSGFSFN